MKKTKRNVDIRKLEVGQTMRGKYIGQTTRPWLDRDSGDSKDLTTLVFEEVDEKDGKLTVNPDKGRFGVFQDAGLRTAFENALVKEGEIVEIVKLEKADIGGGRTCNQYDIFSLS